MKNIISRQDPPALVAIAVGALVGVLPLFASAPPETAFITLLCGMFTVMIGTKRLFSPGRLDPFWFVLCGVLIALSPFMPLAGAAWIKLVAGGGIAMLGGWLYLSGRPEPEGPGPAAHRRATDLLRHAVAPALDRAARAAAAIRSGLMAR
jgi:hypothetical protein